MNYIDYSQFFHHPLKNFTTNEVNRNSNEHEFGTNFINSYAKQQNGKVHFIRELPVPGSGIADLVVLKTPGHFKIEDSRATIQSFEFKLVNWRRGLMQAYRYKSFSNTTVLVLPTEKIESVKNSIELFRKLGVGLWLYCPQTGIIKKAFTPRPKQVIDIKRAKHVLDKSLITTNHS